jgi:hypothetical protein
VLRQGEEVAKELVGPVDEVYLHTATVVS